MIVMEPGALTLQRFAKRLGYESARSRECAILLKMLQKKGIMEIQQGGFKGHSLAHHKIVVIHKRLELENVERINANLQVNFMMGPYGVHRARKTFKCDGCGAHIWSGERYGSNARIARRRSRHSRVRVYKVRILCLPCLILRYEDWLVV